MGSPAHRAESSSSSSIQSLLRNTLGRGLDKLLQQPPGDTTTRRGPMQRAFDIQHSPSPHSDKRESSFPSRQNLVCKGSSASVNQQFWQAESFCPTPNLTPSPASESPRLPWGTHALGWGGGRAEGWNPHSNVLWRHACILYLENHSLFKKRGGKSIGH